MIDGDRLDVGNLHRILGVVMAFVFVGTGAYMRLAHDGLAEMDDAQRLLFRSVHIYLLLASLVNFTLGIHFWLYPRKSHRALQRVGSTLVALSPALFVLGFFNEPWLDELQRPFSMPAIFAIAIGCLLHLIAYYLNHQLKEESAKKGG